MSKISGYVFSSEKTNIHWPKYTGKRRYISTLVIQDKYFLDIHMYKYQMVGYMTLLTPLLFLFKKKANVFNTKSYISSLP